MICTSIEQSKHLLELGLDPKTADCHYKDIGNVGEHYKLEVGGLVGNNDIPAWSLSALLEVMPEGTELMKMQNYAHKLYYEIDYMFTGYEDSDPITTVYEMVCWLLEQGLIKKGDNDEQ